MVYTIRENKIRRQILDILHFNPKPIQKNVEEFDYEKIRQNESYSYRVKNTIHCLTWKIGQVLSFWRHSTNTITMYQINLIWNVLYVTFSLPMSFGCWTCDRVSELMSQLNIGRIEFQEHFFFSSQWQFNFYIGLVKPY